MSHALKEPLSAFETRATIRSILAGGVVSFSNHAESEMKNDNLKTGDVLNVLRGGLMTEPAEFQFGSWRYRIRTNKIVVVVAFRDKTRLCVVTAWRLKK